MLKIVKEYVEPNKIHRDREGKLRVNGVDFRWSYGWNRGYYIIDDDYFYYPKHYGKYAGEIHKVLGWYPYSGAIVIATGVEDDIKKVCKIISEFYLENKTLLNDYARYDIMEDRAGMDYVLSELGYPVIN